MTRLKPKKVLLKCECGETVAQGSVFCLFCKDEVQKINASVILREDKMYQKEMRGKGKRR